MPGILAKCSHTRTLGPDTVEKPRIYREKGPSGASRLLRKTS